MVKIIFMIDDDEDDRDIFREALLKCCPNINLLFATDGVEALNFLRSYEVIPDAIFLDINMPRMNGIECLRNLIDSAITKDIPVVMHTTSADEEVEKVVMQLGANYYMTKPASFDQLCNELAPLLDNIFQKSNVSTQSKA